MNKLIVILFFAFLAELASSQNSDTLFLDHFKEIKVFDKSLMKMQYDTINNAYLFSILLIEKNNINISYFNLEKTYLYGNKFKLNDSIYLITYYIHSDFNFVTQIICTYDKINRKIISKLIVRDDFPNKRNFEIIDLSIIVTTNIRVLKGYDEPPTEEYTNKILKNSYFIDVNYFFQEFD